MNTFLPEIAARSTLVLAAALLSVLAMRKRSASERHLVLTWALGVCVALPLAFATLPEWPWKVLGAGEDSAPEIRVRIEPGERSEVAPEIQAAAPGKVVAPAPFYLDLSASLSVFLALGTVGQGLRLLAGVLHLGRMRRRARSFKAAGIRKGEIEVLLSDETATPFLTGFARPAIVLPAEAAAWPKEKLRMVFCHELAHVRRRDHWLLPLCAAARLLYWWNPLAWLALASQRRERERACDDLVIEEVRASDYAALLVEAAREASGRGLRPALAMAASSNVERRVRALLDRSVSRRRATAKAVCGVAGAGLLLGALLCTVRLARADPEPASAKQIDGSVPASVDGAPRPRNPASEVIVGKDLQRSVQVDGNDNGDGQQIRIEAKLVEMSVNGFPEVQQAVDALLALNRPLSKDVFQRSLRRLDQARGVDLMSAPTLTMKPGRKGTISVTREFRYPSEFERGADGAPKPTKYETRNLGIELEVQPGLSGKEILLSGLLRQTGIDGYDESEPGIQMPIFTVKEARIVRKMASGETAGTSVWARFERPKVSERMPDGTEQSRDEWIKRRLLVFLTVTLVDKAPDPSDAPPRAEPASGARGKMPYGTPVSGKPGFVTSPFAPDSGEVDVRGFDPNTEVKCPYTGKIFLVP